MSDAVGDCTQCRFATEPFKGRRQQEIVEVMNGFERPVAPMFFPADGVTCQRFPRHETCWLPHGCGEFKPKEPK